MPRQNNVALLSIHGGLYGKSVIPGKLSAAFFKPVRLIVLL